MPNQSATNLSPIIRLLPEAPPQDRIDPVPAMRRELSLLRIELERLRVLENETRQTNKKRGVHRPSHRQPGRMAARNRASEWLMLNTAGCTRQSAYAVLGTD